MRIFADLIIAFLMAASAWLPVDMPYFGSTPLTPRKALSTRISLSDFEFAFERIKAIMSDFLHSVGNCQEDHSACIKTNRVAFLYISFNYVLVEKPSRNSVWEKFEIYFAIWNPRAAANES